MDNNVVILGVGDVRVLDHRDAVTERELGEHLAREDQRRAGSGPERLVGLRVQGLEVGEDAASRLAMQLQHLQARVHVDRGPVHGRQVARELGTGHRVAAISPDSGARYLTTSLYKDLAGGDALTGS